MNFQNIEVTDLFEVVKFWCHPDHPFLAMNYPPALRMPAVDFTPFISTCLENKKHQALHELFGYLIADSALREKIVSHWINIRPIPWLTLPAAAAYEIQAMRLSLSRHALNRSLSTTSTTKAEAFASFARQLIASRLSLQPGVIYATTFSQHKKSGEKRLAQLAHVEAPLGPEASVAERLALVPPMTRLVVIDYFSRGWTQGQIKFSLGYTEREYGCCAYWNQYYIRWLNFFEPPTKPELVPWTLKNEQLLEKLKAAGVKVKDSAKRDKLLSLAAQTPDLLPSILREYSPEALQVKPEWKAPLQAWLNRYKLMLDLAGEIHQSPTPRHI